MLESPVSPSVPEAPNIYVELGKAEADRDFAYDFVERLRDHDPRLDLKQVLEHLEKTRDVDEAIYIINDLLGRPSFSQDRAKDFLECVDRLDPKESNAP